MEFFVIGLLVGLIAGLILGGEAVQSSQRDAAERLSIVIDGKLYALVPAKAVKDE